MPTHVPVRILYRARAIPISTCTEYLHIRIFGTTVSHRNHILYGIILLALCFEYISFSVDNLNLTEFFINFVSYNWYFRKYVSLFKSRYTFVRQVPVACRRRSRIMHIRTTESQAIPSGLQGVPPMSQRYIMKPLAPITERLIQNSVWMNNYISSFMWDVIIHPC